MPAKESNSEIANRASQASWWGRVFALDPRSLAVYRIALGLLLVGDIAFRWPTRVEMLSDEGFFTRALAGEFGLHAIGPDWDRLWWSFYFLNGSAEFATALLIITAILGLMLALGLWTRLVTIGLYLMIVSLHYRNPLVITSGDLFLKTQLLWSMFLPLGQVWSVDAWRLGRRTKEHLAPVVSAASAGFILQLIAMYFFTGLSKLNEVWFSGDAMWYVLRLDIYLLPMGKQLLEYPILLKWISWATLFVEVVWIWTLVIAWKNDFFRWSNLLAYWAFHIGIGLTMSIGLFPLICMIAWLPLVPMSFWRTPLNAPARFPRWFDLPVAQRLVWALCIVLIVVTWVWNIGNIPHPAARAFRPRLLASFVYRLGLDQHFRMFDQPPDRNPWFVYEARLKDGTEVDLMTGKPVTYQRPESVREAFPSFHWRKFYRNLVLDHLEYMRPHLADYWLRRWNETHGPEQQVVRMRLICFLEKTGPDYDGKDIIRIVWGSTSDEQEQPGSLFDSLKDSDSDLPF